MTTEIPLPSFSAAKKHPYVIVGAIVFIGGFFLLSRGGSSSGSVDAQASVQSQALANGLNGQLAALTVQQNVAQINASQAIRTLDRQAASAEFLATLATYAHLNDNFIQLQMNSDVLDASVQNNQIVTAANTRVEELLSAERLKELPQILTSQKTLAQIEANTMTQIAKIQADTQEALARYSYKAAKAGAKASETGAWLDFGSGLAKTGAAAITAFL